MDGSMPRRSLRLRVALLVWLSLVPVFLLPATARACSCGRADLEDSSREMGVNAFIGVVTRVSARDGGVIYRFQVDDVVAGNLGSKLVAESTPPDGGGSCGVDLVVGERAAFVLGRHAATWVVSTCGQEDPDDMLQAASFLGFLQSRSAYPWFALVAVVFVIGVIRSRKRPRRSSLA